MLPFLSFLMYFSFFHSLTFNCSIHSLDKICFNLHIDILLTFPTHLLVPLLVPFAVLRSAGGVEYLNGAFLQRFHNFLMHIHNSLSIYFYFVSFAQFVWIFLYFWGFSATNGMHSALRCADLLLRLHSLALLMLHLPPPCRVCLLVVIHSHHHLLHHSHQLCWWFLFGFALEAIGSAMGNNGPTNTLYIYVYVLCSLSYI